MKNQSVIFMRANIYTELSGIGAIDKICWNEAFGHIGGLDVYATLNCIGGTTTLHMASLIGHDPIPQKILYSALSKLGCQKGIGEVG